MHVSGRAVQKVVFTAVASSGDRFALVVCDDGRLGITRNAALLPELSWSVADAEGCVAELLRLAEINLKTCSCEDRQSLPAAARRCADGKRFDQFSPLR
jgi:hypothetical protein